MKKRKTLLKHKVCQPNRLKFFSNKKRYELYKVSDAMCKSIEENLCIHQYLKSILIRQDCKRREISLTALFWAVSLRIDGARATDEAAAAAATRILQIRKEVNTQCDSHEPVSLILLKCK